MPVVVPGEPRFAFSPDGEPVIAAGLRGASTLISWQIHGPAPQRIFDGSPVMYFHFSRDGQRIRVQLGGLLSGTRWEIYDAAGTRLLAGALGQRAQTYPTADGRRVVTRDDEGVTLFDTGNGQVLWKLPCKDCFRVQPSADGNRLFTSSGKRLAVWTIGSPDPIWTGSERVGSVEEGMSISSDGSRVAWINARTAHVHTIGGSTELEATFDENLRDLEFSATRDCQPWRDRDVEREPVEAALASSQPCADRRGHPVVRGRFGAACRLPIDGIRSPRPSGHHLGTVPVSKPSAVLPEDKVLPSLKAKISKGDGRWELWSFPEPDHSPPRESLARITSATGLELVGAELLDTVPGSNSQ
jgi:hypothetical protein